MFDIVPNSRGMLPKFLDAQEETRQTFAEEFWDGTRITLEPKTLRVLILLEAAKEKLVSKHASPGLTTIARAYRSMNAGVFRTMKLQRSLRRASGGGCSDSVG